MTQLLAFPPSVLRERLRIEFCDEPGIDAGGLFREWSLLMSQEFFSATRGLFEATRADNLSYWINSSSSQMNPDALMVRDALN